jgi:hypothetical protein
VHNLFSPQLVKITGHTGRNAPFLVFQEGKAKSGFSLCLLPRNFFTQSPGISW